jgi:hypothetical protein
MEEFEEVEAFRSGEIVEELSGKLSSCRECNQWGLIEGPYSDHAGVVPEMR